MFVASLLKSHPRMGIFISPGTPDVRIIGGNFIHAADYDGFAVLYDDIGVRFFFIRAGHPFNRRHSRIEFLFLNINNHGDGFIRRYMGYDIQFQGNILELCRDRSLRGQFSYRYALALQDLCLSIINREYLGIRDDFAVSGCLDGRELKVKRHCSCRIDDAEGKS